MEAFLSVGEGDTETDNRSEAQGKMKVVLKMTVKTTKLCQCRVAQQPNTNKTTNNTNATATCCVYFLQISGFVIISDQCASRRGESRMHNVAPGSHAVRFMRKRPLVN